MTRSRLFIYIIAGGYVAYTGLGLAKNALTQRPDNYMLYLAIGVLFLIFGGFIAVRSALRISKGDYSEGTEGSEEESQEDIREDTGESD